MGCDCKKKIIEDPIIQTIQQNIENSKKDLESIIERLSQKIYEMEQQQKPKIDEKEYLSFKDVK